MSVQRATLARFPVASFAIVVVGLLAAGVLNLGLLPAALVGIATAAAALVLVGRGNGLVFEPGDTAGAERRRFLLITAVSGMAGLVYIPALGYLVQMVMPPIPIALFGYLGGVSFALGAAMLGLSRKYS